MICLECKNPGSHLSGISCGNYGFKHTTGHMCRGAWQVKCFHLKHDNPFPRALVPKTDLLDKGSATDWEFTKEEKEDRKLEFAVTFGWAHLICPFSMH